MVMVPGGIIVATPVVQVCILIMTTCSVDPILKDNAGLHSKYVCLQHIVALGSYGRASGMHREMGTRQTFTSLHSRITV